MANLTTTIVKRLSQLQVAMYELHLIMELTKPVYSPVFGTLLYAWS
jgi:hypothetical protein